MSFKVYVVFWLLLLPAWVSGQQLPLASIRQKGDFYLEQKTFLIPQKEYRISVGIKFTSFVIQINANSSFNNSYVIINSNRIPLTPDEHSPIQNGRINSNLISVDGEAQLVQLFSGVIEGEIHLHFLNSSPLVQKDRTSIEINQRGDCSMQPSTVAQKNWRSGLPQPTYTRAFSEVNHLIVHHSAGSNTNSNYTQVVRDIYLYHTEVNGWSDIGYNYLIAQDGTIYAGRDPDGGSQDNVRGAHFCGMNTGTMGICLLGTYTTIEPSEEAVASLINLATWKLNIEALNPLESFPFRALPQLGVVSGHREGCATECPGQMTFDRLSEFRQSIHTTLQSCDPDQQIGAEFSIGVNTIFEGEVVNFIDDSFGGINTWNWSFQGGTPAVSNDQNPSNITYQTSGKFDVQLIVRSGARVDTLLKEGFVEVLENSGAINVYPNPVRKGKLITIKFNVELNEPIVITDMLGKQVLVSHPTSKKFSLDTSAMDKGIYVLHFSKGRVVGSKRFVIY